MLRRMMTAEGATARSTWSAWPLASRRAGAQRAGQHVVVVGNGMVSHRFCRALVGDGNPALRRITVLGEESLPAYDRIRLSESLQRSPEELLLDPAQWYEENGIDLRLGTAVRAIDREHKTIQLSSGENLGYDVLVLATGAAPLLPPITGIDGPRVFVYRTTADVQRIREATQSGARAAVIGGGLLGIEAAKVLRAAEANVTLVEQGKALMPRQLDGDSGALLEQRVKAQGVDTWLGERLLEIQNLDGCARLLFESERQFDADVVVVAVGIRPRDELARAVGLKLGARGGVIVDDRLRTSERDIYAIGECAVHRGKHYGLVAPGYAMADALAAQLRGDNQRFRRGDLSCQLKLLDVPVAAVGIYDQEAQLVAFENDEGRRTLLLDGRRLIGATAVGAWPQIARVQDAALREERISSRRIARFLDTGELWDESEQSVDQWPAATVVCNCTGVTRGELSGCVGNGLVSVEALTRKTGAGSVCGSCKPLLGQLVGAPVAADTAGTGMMRFLSAAALVLLAVLVFAPSVPAAASVQSPLLAVNHWLSDDWNKQLTGFSLLGAAVLGTLLSARKRLRFLRLGQFGYYRAFHTFASFASLALLIVHTGLRAGSHLNFALFCCFVGLSVLGGLAGLSAAAETSGGPIGQVARRYRSTLTLLHIILLWPLPVLLGLHIFAAYYF